MLPITAMAPCTRRHCVPRGLCSFSSNFCNLKSGRIDPTALPFRQDNPLVAQPMSHPLDPLFKPRRVVFIGGSNLRAALRYQKEMAFHGETWVVNPKYTEIEGFRCFSRVEDLPGTPDLAFVAIRREASIEALRVLRERGCRAFVCNAAGFAETGETGVALQAQLVEAAGGLPCLGPNTVGLVNQLEPMAAIMDHFGVAPVPHGVAVVSQGGGLLCDAAFCDRSLALTHLVGCGNQAVTGAGEIIDYLLDDPRVRAVGLSFEGLRDVRDLRRAALKALRLEKPIVALKFGRTQAGARASASHTASMTGVGAAWEALFQRLGIISTRSESAFFETLKLIDAGQLPRGRRALVAAASGVMGIMVADQLSDAGFELPQPSDAQVTRLRELLPGIATPCNPQDVTMAAWNDHQRQQAIYATLLEDHYDIAIMVQNYPRAGMWDINEYSAQVQALGDACQGRDIAALQLAPMVDCFPASAREHTQALGLAPMQGLDECIQALGHGLWWRERREALLSGDPETLTAHDVPPPSGSHLDEATAKQWLRDAAIPVPEHRVCPPQQAVQAATALGFPVVLKALDARLLHKSECGAVRVGLGDGAAVAAALQTMSADMARLVPDIPLEQVLVERMAEDVVAELMVSISHDASVGSLMMIAGGGTQAELWNDSALLAAPFSRHEIHRTLLSLKSARLLQGWRGKPMADMESLLDTLEAIANFALSHRVEELEINPILVGERHIMAVDALLKMRPPTGTTD